MELEPLWASFGGAEAWDQTRHTSVMQAQALDQHRTDFTPACTCTRTITPRPGEPGGHSLGHRCCADCGGI